MESRGTVVSLTDTAEELFKFVRSNDAAVVLKESIGEAVAFAESISNIVRLVAVSFTLSTDCSVILLTSIQEAVVDDDAVVALSLVTFDCKAPSARFIAAFSVFKTIVALSTVALGCRGSPVTFTVAAVALAEA